MPHQKKVSEKLLIPDSTVIVAWFGVGRRLHSASMDTTQPDVQDSKTGVWGRNIAVAIVDTVIHGSFMLENTETKIVVGDGSRAYLASKKDGLYLMKEHYSPNLEGGTYTGDPTVRLCTWERVVHVMRFPYYFCKTPERIFLKALE